MTRVTWDDLGSRLYQAGVDRGMLYTGSDIPEASVWDGLVSITQGGDGGDPQPYYLDGQKILNIPSGENYSATIEAFSAPIEFALCVGRNRISTGLFAADQPRKTFGFSYRTLIGNGSAGTAYGYKIHVVYNATAQGSDFTHETLTDSPQASVHSWSISTCPIAVPGHRPTAHFIFDTRLNSKTGVADIEDILYGNDDDDPRLPTEEELATLLEVEDSIFFGGVDLHKMSLS
jgi:hypothetical protein